MLFQNKWSKNADDERAAKELEEKIKNDAMLQEQKWAKERDEKMAEISAKEAEAEKLRILENEQKEQKKQVYVFFSIYFMFISFLRSSDGYQKSLTALWDINRDTLLCITLTFTIVKVF